MPALLRKPAPSQTLAQRNVSETQEWRELTKRTYSKLSPRPSPSQYVAVAGASAGSLCVYMSLLPAWICSALGQTSAQISGSRKSVKRS